VEIRRRIIEENRLDGVVSMPSGVFKPYAGVSTAVLFFTRGAQTKDIWFYDMAHDGFSLDDKRVAIDENDIPDVVNCWENRMDKKFIESREKRIVELRKELTPLKEKRLKLQEDINRLSFELAVETPSALPTAGTSPKSVMETLDDNKDTSVVFGGGRVLQG
jgi:type I restriction enzyme M protein